MSDSVPEAAKSARPDAVQQLVAAAAELMADALRAYAEERPVKVSTSAPLAVEHLAKAALWQTNPVLLVPLEKDKETSLHVLATDPNLTDPRLRTVGLDLALKRVGQLITLPGTIDARRAMIAARNGAVHVGESTSAREVLITALTIAGSLLEELLIARTDFFGDHAVTVDELLAQRRTAIQEGLDRRKAAARVHLGELRSRIGEEGLGDLESKTLLYEPEDRGAVDEVCPVCEFQGNLEGELQTDYEVDVEPERMGDGWDYSYSAHPYWLLVPERFSCGVCGLSLSGPDELEAVGLPNRRFPPDGDVRTGENLFDAAAADFSETP